MSFVAAAIVGSSLIGGIVSSSNANAARNQLAQNSIEEQKAYKEAQQLLQKGQEEAISSLEAADLKARGLIDDAAFKAITALNNTQGGAIQTMKEFTKKSADIFASAQQATVKDLVNSGLLAADTVNGATLKSIQAITGWNDQAFDYITGGNEKAIQAIKEGSDKSIASLQPYADAGEKAIQKIQFLGGMLNPEQKAEALKEFGSTPDSPLYQFQLAEATKATDRYLKASGQAVGSGFGAELAQKANLAVSAQEAERQMQAAQSLANTGYGAASQIANINQNSGNQTASYNAQTGQLTGNLSSQAGTNIAGLTANAGNTVANQQQLIGQELAQYNNQYGQNLANLNNNLGTNIANLQYSTGTTQADIAQQSELNKARMASLLGSNIANLQSSNAVAQANSLTGAATQQYNSGIQQAQLGYQAAQAPWQALGAGLNAALQYGAQQNAGGIPGATPQYNAPGSPYYVSPGLGG